MSSIQKRPDGRWRARYRDDDGKEFSRHFKYKDNKRFPEESAQHWLDTITASVMQGTYVSPRSAKTTVGEWLDTWLEGYATRRPSTVRQAKVHAAHIREAFGRRRLADIRPSEVKAWCAKLKADGLADSFVYACHSRLAQVYRDAVHDGIVPRSPCSRRTSPPMGKQRPYVASTEQVWALYDAVPEHLQPAILLGAFVGLRTAEVCGLRTGDVDFARGIVTPAVQYPAEPLKTETSQTPVPIPRNLSNMLAAHAEAGTWLLRDPFGAQVGPWQIDRAVREVRRGVGLPDGFRFHDLRHYFASTLIAAGADVKVVQARVRHASAKTTLDTYAHLWPDTEEATRTAIGAAIAERVASIRADADSLRTQGATQ